MQRFISPDVYISTGQGIVGNNMFAYCDNNSSNMSDFVGALPIRNKNVMMTDSFLKGRTIYDSIVLYKVPLYTQYADPICWAVCQIMIESYYDNVKYCRINAYKKAKELAKKVLGSKWRDGGHPTNAGKRISISSFKELADIIINEGPCYARYEDDNKEGHLVVVIGVNLTKKTICTNNPWGISKWQTFTEFLNGVATDLFHRNGTLKFDCIFLVKRD